MAQTRKYSAFVPALLVSMFSAVMAAQAGDPAVLQQRLSSQIKLTTTTADRTDIVTPGDIVVIHKPGLVMFSLASLLPPTTVYKDGKLEQGFGTQLLMSDPSRQIRRFEPGEKCWVTGIEVSKDSVSIDLYSDPYDDVRYFGTLKIPFPDKKEVPPVDSFLATIAEVLTVVPQAPGNQQGGGPDGSGAPVPGPAQGPGPGPAQGQQASGFSGDFVQQAGMHLILFPDGSFKITIANGRLVSLGQFSVDGDSLTLSAWNSNASPTLSIQGDKLLAGRIVWSRVGDAPAPAVTPGQIFPGTTDAQRAAFAGEYLRQADGLRNTLFTDGTFQATLPTGRTVSGQYSVDGNTAVLTSPAALAGQRYTLMADKLISQTGSDFFVRVGDAPAPATTAAAAPAPMPAIAPPPPPPDAPPPTIALGQTKAQVTAAFGQPVRMAKLGAKEIFYYKDMKVTFTNEKVSNVE